MTDSDAETVALEQTILPVKQHIYYNVPRNFTMKFEPS